MGLTDTPPTRERTYTTSTPVNPNDLNEIQDRIIDILGGDQMATVTATDVVAGELHFTEQRTQIISGADSIDPNGTHTRQASGVRWLLGSSTNRIVYPIHGLKVGDRIHAFEIALTKNSTSAQTINARLYRMHEDGTEVALGAGASNAENSPGATSISETGINHDVVLQYQYYLVLNPASGGAGDFAAHAYAFVSRP